MALEVHDTIFALGSGLLPSGVALIRLSGPHCRFVIETILQKPLRPRYGERVLFCNPGDKNSVIDDGLALWFPGPASFTGEDVLELHCHGSKAVVSSLLAVLGLQPGLRLAERGEFTRRAFLNNKLDLVEVEGLSDLIVAETDYQRALARHQLSGKVGSFYDAWRQKLIKARALIEAELDFPDEDDVPGSVSDQVWPLIHTMIDEMTEAIKSFRASERVRDGVQVVLAGLPNAGKSSLLNAIVGREAAIVSSVAGTTRDIIDVHLNLDGIAVRLSDTAGLRDHANEIEAIGIERATQRIKQADLVLFLEDVTLDHKALKQEKILQNLLLPFAQTKIIRIGTKSDLLNEEEDRSIRDRYDFLCSVEDNSSIIALLDFLAVETRQLVAGFDSGVVLRERHYQAVMTTLNYLSDSLFENKAIELRAEDLRAAAAQLGRVTGRVDIDDLLDVVFREFCIGK